MAQRVGGVGGRRLGLGQQNLQHHRDLALVGDGRRRPPGLPSPGWARIRRQRCRTSRAPAWRRRGPGRVSTSRRRPCSQRSARRRLPSAGGATEDGGEPSSRSRAAGLRAAGHPAVPPSRRRRRSSRLPSASITPQPVRRRPGSMPMMRTGTRDRECGHGPVIAAGRRIENRNRTGVTGEALFALPRADAGRALLKPGYASHSSR